MCGLLMCYSSRTNKYINLNKPSHRDGLIRPDIDELDDDDNPFCNNIIDYYSKRPTELEHISLAEFASDYDLVYRSKMEKSLEAIFTEPNDATGGYTGSAIKL